MELPVSLIETVVERGQILHSDIFEDIDHPKFFVVIGVSENKVAGFFYINSRINTSVNRKQEQLDMQYPLLVSDYPFLDHTSYICATNVVTMDKAVLVESITNNRTKVVDVLKANHLDELLCKLRQSRLFSPIIKRQFFY